MLRFFGIIFLCLPISAQIGSGPPPAFAFDGSAREWEALPPTLTLTPAQAGGREGRLWARLTTDGLLLAGSMTGGAPQWPRTEKEMAQRDHVEVWLAPGAIPALPPIGWGNQFGPVEDKTEKDCPELASDAGGVTKCQSWFRKQPGYRTQIRRLFVRQWQVAPEMAAETFAQPAWKELEARWEQLYKDTIAPLKPAGSALRQQFVNTPKGYDFEMTIPWDAFPPSDSLAIGQLRLMVDVFSSHDGQAKGQPYATSAKGRKWGDPASFTLLQAQSPRPFRLTACEYPLKATDIYREAKPAYFIPTASGDIHFVFVLQNFAVGYQNSPEGWSPIVRQTEYFEKPLEAGEFLCGPALRYRKGATVRSFEEAVSNEGFGWKPLPDGGKLLRFGPRVFYSEFGSGQCGACPRVDLTMGILTSDLHWIKAFNHFTAVDDVEAFDLDVSTDWRKVTVYKDGAAESFCLNGTKYAACGKKAGVKPPTPRKVRIQ